MNGRCKSKKNYDEFEKVKDNMKIIINNNQNLEKEIIDLKKEIINYKKEINNNQKLEKGIINLKKEIDKFKNLCIFKNTDNNEVIKVFY